MAVLVEALSVIVRRDSIERYIVGGWEKFLDFVPNQTMCTDGDLVRVGFMSPRDVEDFVIHLEGAGLQFHYGNEKLQAERGLRVSGDIIVVDQMKGPTTECDWVEFGSFSIEGEDIKIPTCWLFEGPRIAAGLHFSSKQMTLATPEGWTPANLKSMHFMANEPGVQ